MKPMLIALMSLAMAWATASIPVSGRQESPDLDEIEIHGTITAKGRFIFAWVEDDLCAIQFWDYDFTPDLVVTDEMGKELASLPLATLPGAVTMEGPAGDQHAEICTVPYTLTVPHSNTYRVVLDPYFKSEPLTSTDLAKALNINFERQEGDPGPDFHDRPSGPIPGTDQFRIAGTFEIRPDADEDADDISFLSMPLGGCVTLGGYDDIKIGTQITVRDQSGTIIGVGELEPIHTEMNKCEFTFTIAVPNVTFYTFEMGRRGEITYTKQELEQADWHVDLVIGP